MKVRKQPPQSFVAIQTPTSPKQTHNGKKVTIGISNPCSSKVIAISLTLLSIAALAYLSVCDITDHSYCTVKNSTQIALNLQTLASIFR